MLTDTQFEAANELRLANGDKAFVNPRNGVAGALRGSRDRTYIIPMTFFAYQVLPLPDTYSGPKPNADIAYSAAIELLGELGVHTAATTRAGIAVVDTLPQAQEYIDALLAARADLGFGIDGAVIKADAYADREAAGSSSRAPRWGTAYKYPSDSRLTTLEEVIWQVGRTGVITPRGRVAPVFVGGVTVSYATLHNPNDLARQGLMIGDTVMVLRAGEVIPRIEASSRPPAPVTRPRSRCRRSARTAAARSTAPRNAGAASRAASAPCPRPCVTPWPATAGTSSPSARSSCANSSTPAWSPTSPTCSPSPRSSCSNSTGSVRPRPPRS